jgi:hypothetical protein
MDFLVFLRKHDAVFSGDRIYLGLERCTFDRAVALYWEEFQ